MTKRQVQVGNGVLTCERAESSHGQPVLVVNGEAYGPMDMVFVGSPVHSIITAAEYVRQYGRKDRHGLIDRFLRNRASA